MTQVSLNDWFAEETIDLIARMIKRRTGTAPLTVLDLYNTLKEENDTLDSETIEFIKECIESIPSDEILTNEPAGESLFSP